MIDPFDEDAWSEDYWAKQPWFARFVRFGYGGTFLGFISMMAFQIILVFGTSGILAWFFIFLQSV